MRGFSFAELLVMLAVLTILAASAYPSYFDHVRRARMTDAQRVLVEAADWMEREYEASNAYPTELPESLRRSPKRGKPRYTIALDQDLSGEQSFTLSATPDPGQHWRNCAPLILSQYGAKSPAACWR
jgi:type IV pilus assembly protein PilE